METVTENGDVSAPTPSEFQSTKERLSGLLNGFYRAPFTVQRLLELLLEPNKHYRKFDKYARGLEKVGTASNLFLLSAKVRRNNASYNIIFNSEYVIPWHRLKSFIAVS